MEPDTETAAIDRDIIENREWIEKHLAALDFVEFDRFTLSRWGEHQGVTVYGWIEREDSYKDFVVLIFWPANEDFYFVTSSDEWTNEIQRRLGGEPDDHNSCKRVEHAFDVQNAIELEGSSDER